MIALPKVAPYLTHIYSFLQMDEDVKLKTNGRCQVKSRLLAQNVGVETNRGTQTWPESSCLVRELTWNDRFSEWNNLWLTCLINKIIKRGVG